MHARLFKYVTLNLEQKRGLSENVIQKMMFFE